MLIHLDSSLCAELDPNSTSRNDALLFFTRLADLRYKGQHLVTGSRDILTLLKDCPDLGMVERTVYQHLHTQSAEDRALHKLVTRRLEITGNSLSSEPRVDGQCRVLRLPLQRVTKLATPSILLSENLTDCEFFKLVGNIYLINYGMKRFILAFDERAGGGATTVNTYSQVQAREDSLCLCIVDSDLKHPNAPLGQTARKLQNADKPDKHMTELHILPVRECENLLSPDMLGNLDPHVKIVDHEKLLTHKDAPYKYFDVKDGLRLGEVRCAAASSPFQSYWHSVLTDIGLDPSAPPSPCPKGHPCCTASAKNPRTSCTCYLIRGVGDRILHTLTKNTMHSHAVNQLIPPDLRVLWDELGAVIVAWGCAGSPLRTLGSAAHSRVIP